MTSFETATAEGWFPKTAEDVPGWRLDIVSLLAVIGESSMAEHSQAMTATWTCCLPRIIPAPQALLKPTRPTRMPQVNAAVVGVVNGTCKHILGVQIFPFVHVSHTLATCFNATFVLKSNLTGAMTDTENLQSYKP